jgi:MFS superfamily sulfate permease-like transporter
VVLMIVTAVMVIATDFLTGVLSGMALYALLFKFCDRPPAARREIASPPSDTEKDLPERDEAHHELVGVA